MKIKKKLIQFGAGNIGRSFIGQVFSQAGYEVVFVDVNNILISGLNKKKEYKVVIKKNNAPDSILLIRNVRAVHAQNVDRITEEIVTADLISTSVGKGALSKVIPTLSRGLNARYSKNPENSIDIIIAENIRDGALYFRKELMNNLPESFPLDQFTGLVETSIGKMVPIMGKDDLREDPLWVFAEPYNQLILDKKSLKKPLPLTDSIKLVNNIHAYVDRKLFIHNLGHAAAAYFGYLYHPEKKYLYQILKDEQISLKVRTCMNEAASALCKEYPLDFTIENLQEHIEDLINRFQNKALGDTTFRIGRDLPRKLEKNDRLIGAILLCRKHKQSCSTITEAAAAGFYFKATDENNTMLKQDEDFFQKLYSEGIDSILHNICHLNRQNVAEKRTIDDIILYFNKYRLS